MYIGEKGFVIRLSDRKFAFVEPELVSLYWYDEGRTVIKYEDGRVFPLEEGEVFMPKINLYSGVAVTVGEAVDPGKDNAN